MNLTLTSPRPKGIACLNAIMAIAAESPAKSEGGPGTFTSETLHQLLDIPHTEPYREQVREIMRELMNFTVAVEEGDIKGEYALFDRVQIAEKEGESPDTVTVHFNTGLPGAINRQIAGPDPIKIDWNKPTSS